MDKHIRHEWHKPNLSQRQKEYAAGDVLYLHNLVKEIKRGHPMGSLFRYQDIIQALRIKASLEVEGYTDILDYPQARAEDTKVYREWWLKKEFFNHQSHLYSKGGEGCLNQPQGLL